MLALRQQELAMTLSTASPPHAGRIATEPTDYVPGVCNIGPAEIARRRRAGHTGVIATIVLFAVLVAIDAPTWTRLFLLLPAAVAASGYLQARLRFCAGFGQRGVFNFGDVGTSEHVADPDARSRDRAMAFRIGAAAFGIGLVVAIAAVLLPV
jgi:hypothetical protein